MNEISNMDFRQLRTYVQQLNDELARMKRSYEDILYNLDNDNFSSSILKEKNGMKTKIEVNEKKIRTEVTRIDGEMGQLSSSFEQTAEGFRTQVTRIDGAVGQLSSQLTQTAEGFHTEVLRIDGKFADYSTVTQTAGMIETKVASEREYVDHTLQSYSTTTQTANEISSAVHRIETNFDTKLEQYSTISQTAGQIQSVVTQVETVQDTLNSDYYTKTQTNSEITQTASGILSSVSATYETKSAAGVQYSTLNSRISQTATDISLIVSGQKTGDILNSSYFSGLKIEKDAVRVFSGSAGASFSKTGLRFYNAQGLYQGWAIEPNSSFGGVLNYYVNDYASYAFGSEMTRSGWYSTSDIVLKALRSNRGRFVVDVTDSGNPEVMFVGLNTYGGSNSPCIYVNGQMLATQSWVLENAGGSGTSVAVFA